VPGPPSPPFSLACGVETRTPLPPFPSPPALCAAASELSTEPFRAVPRSPHRLTTGRPSHPRRRVSASSVSRSSGRRGSQVAPPVTGVPPPPWDIIVPPPLRPCTSSCCSAEPSTPPPRQVHCRRPHGAHVAFFGTPCPPEHADQPVGPGCQAVAQPTSRPATCGRLPHLAPQAMGRFEARLCASILIVFQLI
jgi:hypothetical protein